MLHLLTEEHRQKVIKEYRKRILVVFFLGLLFVSVISAIFILPTFFLSYGRYSDFKIKEKTLDSELLLIEGAGSSEGVKDVALTIEALQMFADKKSVTVLIENVTKERPQGVQIKNLIFTPGEAKTMIIDIAGRADTRRSLVTFEQNLKANAFFDDVVVPIGSFAKEKNIDFSMKLFASASTTASTSITQDEKQN